MDLRKHEVGNWEGRRHTVRDSRGRSATPAVLLAHSLAFETSPGRVCHGHDFRTTQGADPKPALIVTANIRRTLTTLQLIPP